LKELFKLVTLEALIREVEKYVIRRKLYAIPDKSLLKVKQVMKNHIRWKRPLCYNIYLFIFTRTTIMKDLLSKIILLIKIKA
jgi:hypothetical protein